LEMPPEMPPLIARILLEETARAVSSGQTLDELIDHLSSAGLLPEEKGGRKSRRK
jgi:hypothetical protein